MKYRGPWSIEQIQRFWNEARIPIRLACNGSSGSPVLASLWFVPIEDQLWCATQESAHIVSLLQRDPRCAFELSVEAPPYRGVRGPGIATLHPERGESILRRLIDRYLGDVQKPPAPLLLARVEREVAIAIEPKALISWDYRERMGDPG